jgi:hypothetical protein
MARRAFFSFYYDRDIWRANVVRNSWVTKDREAAGFFDASLWEEAEKKGDEAVKKIIDEALKNTSVTVVLVGAQTADRKYVKYEIVESHKRGNGLLAIRIHNIKDEDGRTDTCGVNPFESIYIQLDGIRICSFAEKYKIYDWVINGGYNNMGAWIEAAYKQANP